MANNDCQECEKAGDRPGYGSYHYVCGHCYKAMEEELDDLRRFKETMGKILLTDVCEPAVCPNCGDLNSDERT